MKYFTNVNSKEELRSMYKGLARKLHPDVNDGLDIEFKIMSNEYEQLMKEGFSNKTIREFDLDSMSEEFKKAYSIISELDVEFEVVGSWIWVGNGSYQVKDILKANGFKYASKKKKWYFGKLEGTKRSKGMKYKDIKEKYGVKSANVKVKIV